MFSSSLSAWSWSMTLWSFSDADPVRVFIFLRIFSCSRSTAKQASITANFAFFSAAEVGGESVGGVRLPALDRNALDRNVQIRWIGGYIQNVIPYIQGTSVSELIALATAALCMAAVHVQCHESYTLHGREGRVKRRRKREVGLAGAIHIIFTGYMARYSQWIVYNIVGGWSKQRMSFPNFCLTSWMYTESFDLKSIYFLRKFLSA